MLIVLLPLLFLSAVAGLHFDPLAACGQPGKVTMSLCALSAVISMVAACRLCNHD